MDNINLFFFKLLFCFLTLFVNVGCSESDSKSNFSKDAGYNGIKWGTSINIVKKQLPPTYKCKYLEDNKIHTDVDENAVNAVTNVLIKKVYNSEIKPTANMGENIIDHVCTKENSDTYYFVNRNLVFVGKKPLWQASRSKGDLTYKNAYIALHKNFGKPRYEYDYTIRHNYDNASIDDHEVYVWKNKNGYVALDKVDKSSTGKWAYITYVSPNIKELAKTYIHIKNKQKKKQMNNAIKEVSN